MLLVLQNGDRALDLLSMCKLQYINRLVQTVLLGDEQRHKDKVTMMADIEWWQQQWELGTQVIKCYCMHEGITDSFT